MVTGASVRLQVERVVTIMQNPRQYKIPDWFLNRQKDVKDGKYSQVGEGCGAEAEASGWASARLQPASGLLVSSAQGGGEGLNKRSGGVGAFVAVGPQKLPETRRSRQEPVDTGQAPVPERPTVPSLEGAKAAHRLPSVCPRCGPLPWQRPQQRPEGWNPSWVQVLANGLDNKLREDLERLKKIRAHRGLRHFWG